LEGGSLPLQTGGTRKDIFGDEHPGSRLVCAVFDDGRCVLFGIWACPFSFFSVLGFLKGASDADRRVVPVFIRDMHTFWQKNGRFSRLIFKFFLKNVRKK
jgi:hypothetical protein